MFIQVTSRVTLMIAGTDYHFFHTKGVMPVQILMTVYLAGAMVVFTRVVMLQGRSTSSTSEPMVGMESLCRETMRHGSPVMERHRAKSSWSYIRIL